MKTVPLILLVVTTIMMVYTALAAPYIDMYLLEEDDCRVCHDDTGVLKNVHHELLNESESDGCLDCHIEKRPRKLDCMKLGCHSNPVEDPDPINPISVGVANHHELGLGCFTCHEKGVPRGGR